MDRIVVIIVCTLVLLVAIFKPAIDEPAVEVAGDEAQGVVAEVDAQTDDSPTAEERFPDYEPKLTDDTVLDYRPSLAADIDALPDVTHESFTSVIYQIVQLALAAEANPGEWVDGNQPLGANEKEYVPSNEELLAAELGDRLFIFSESHTIDDIVQNAWKGSMIHPPNVSYTRFDFRHVDVMGSGRFFYASAPEVIELDFGKRLAEESEGP